eukprot:10673751-Alexandrium_andersonii.AAC.1
MDTPMGAEMGTATRVRWIRCDRVLGASFVGRPVQLDAFDRLKYNPPVAKTDFSPDLMAGRMKVLVPCVGVRMVKATAAFRTEVPKPL